MTPLSLGRHPQINLGPKQVVVTFLIVATAYFAVFYGVEHLRHRKGPWTATFAVGADGVPTVTVEQDGLGIDRVQLRFPGEQAAWSGGATNVVFAEPGVKVPFGEVIYEDLTFLPGVVTFNLFGHWVEFMPRVLILDRREVPWASGGVHALDAGDKPAEPPRPPAGSG